MKYKLLLALLILSVITAEATQLRGKINIDVVKFQKQTPKYDKSFELEVEEQESNLGMYGFKHEDYFGSIRVIKVFKDTPADRAGLKPGDIITKTNDKLLYDYSTKNRLGKVGDVLYLQVYRNGKVLYFTIIRESIDKYPELKGIYHK